MSHTVIKEFWIEAAHYLPKMPKNHKCRRMHGHSFHFHLEVTGIPDSCGIVIDYADIKKHWQVIHNLLDHRVLNEVVGLENPTSENISRWVWDRLKPGMPGLSVVRIKETCSAGVEYRNNRCPE